VDSYQKMTRNRGLCLLVLILAAGVVACDGDSRRPESLSVGDAWRSFEGSWNASGTRQTLHLGPDQQASTIRVGGNLSLTDGNSAVLGFRADAIAYSDEHSMIGRAVWTDERGDQVFSELKGEKVGTGNHVTGTIIGGTGRYARATGEYEFQWQYVIAAEEGAVQGRAVGLKGRVRRESIEEVPGSASGQHP